MQLRRKPKSVRRALAMATSSLLSAGAVGQSHGAPVDIDISELYYTETDRVTVNKVQLLARGELPNEDLFKLNVIYDTMTGASPNGRVYVQDGGATTITSTTASGFSFSTTGEASTAAKTWLTPFEDKRAAAGLEWERAWFRNFSTTFGASISRENDYLANGASAKAALDLNQKRTTLTAGTAVNLDTVEPNGGIREGLGTLSCIEPRAFIPTWVDCDVPALYYKPGEKVVTDYIIGITQVWNKKTLMQLNYGRGQSEGYLTDPYKQISVVKDGYGEVAVLYENRPDRRTTNSIYWKLVHVPTKDAIHVSYRYFWDDWDISAHTVDFRLRLEINPRHYLQPHMRYSVQHAAYFFDESLDADGDEPTYVSADHRLGNQHTVTVGLKYGLRLKTGTRIAARGEYLQQKYKDENLPDMEGWIAQLLLTSKF